MFPTIYVYNNIIHKIKFPKTQDMKGLSRNINDDTKDAWTTTSLRGVLFCFIILSKWWILKDFPTSKDFPKVSKDFSRGESLGKDSPFLNKKKPGKTGGIFFKISPPKKIFFCPGGIPIPESF